MGTEAVDEFYKLFKKHLDNNKQAQIRLATCKEVDWEEKTMTAVGISDNLEYYDVSLGLGYKFIKPKVETDCIIGILEGEECVTFLIDAMEVEEIIINEGKNGGLIKIQELTDKVNELVDWCKNHTHTNASFSGTIGSTAVTGAITVPAPIEAPKELNKSDFEDENIKH